MTSRPPAPVERPKSIDEKLARGLVNEELRRLSYKGDFDPVLRDLFEEIKRGVTSLRMRRGKLDATGAGAVIRALHRRAATHPRVLLSDNRSSGNTLSRRKFFAEERLAFISRVPDRREFTVDALFAYASPDEFASEIRPFPFTYGAHVCERFLSRRGDAWNDAGHVIGKALVEKTALLAVLMHPAALLPERRLAIPFGQGLLLGVVDTGEDPYGGFIVDGDGWTDLAPATVRHALPPEGCPLPRMRPLSWMASTYIGPMEMAPPQRETYARLVELEAAVVAGGKDFGEALAWPMGKEFSAAARDAGKHRTFHELCQRGIDLVFDRRAAMAMGNSGEPAFDKPEPPTAYSRGKTSETSSQGYLGGFDLATAPFGFTSAGRRSCP